MLRVELNNKIDHIIPTPIISSNLSSVPSAKIKTNIDKKKNKILEKRSTRLL